MLATVNSATVLGVRGEPVFVEVHVSPGIPGFTIVGQPDATCREARDRVRAAILSSGLTFCLQRVTVNLAPSTVRKVGAGLDLAIAVGLLVASEQLRPEALSDRGFLAELGLDGTLRPVPGLLPMVVACPSAEVVVSPAGVDEARLVPSRRVRPVADLGQLVGVLNGDLPWPDPPDPRPPEDEPTGVDLAEVRGQPFARLALEVAAAGGHHCLLVGPPGAGKTMLAERLPTILPPLDERTAFEVTTVHSAAGELPGGALVRRPPFRAPHHTASQISMVGGGSHALRPGEVSLAHGGVLFLDELGEFSAAVLDALRQPLEEGAIRLSRAHARASIPASFLLVGAMNPCPCGLAGTARCVCGEGQLARYARRLSGPLLDRFDLRLLLTAPTAAELRDTGGGEPSAAVAARVAAARVRAAERGVTANARLGSARLAEVSRLTSDAAATLDRAIDAGRLSGRGLARVRAVALTLDDLRDGDGVLDGGVVARAMALRSNVGSARPGGWR